MEITVLSRETIKPSTPTPHHLKHLKLSLIDQHMNYESYNRILLFFSAQGDPHRFQNENTSELLKTSLSEALTEYYPLAGGFSDTQSVVCNDDGLEYTEARVKSPYTLNQLVACPNPEELDRLIPHDVYSYGTGFKGLSAVQVTIFDDCGGMALGVSVSHLLTDGSSLAIFINRWAAMARGGVIATTPVPEKFTYASFFPPRELPTVDAFQEETEGAMKLVSRRFIFPQHKIDMLKTRFKFQSPSRVVAVTALMFKCLINASKRSSKSIFPGVVVDLGSRASPPFPVDHLGTTAFLSMMGLIGKEMSLNDVGVQLRELIKEFDSDYVKELQANGASLLFDRLQKFMKFAVTIDTKRILAMSSCCNFPFYQVDFGWGVPTMTAPVLRNSCIVLYSKKRDGIEAWLALDEEDMAQFQSDDEILSFTDQSP